MTEAEAATILREAIQAVGNTPVKVHKLPRRREEPLVLSNGYELTVHEPSFDDMPDYFRLLPYLTAVGDLFSGRGDSENADKAMAMVRPFFARMCDISVDALTTFGWEDSAAVFSKCVELLSPKNSSAAKGSNSAPLTDTPLA